LSAPPDAVVHQVALHTETGGDLLPERVAAVELLNFIRPTVAVAWFVTFTAHALLRHPIREPEAFVHEVRRFYPFVPFLAARTREEFLWHGQHFPHGRLVLLDVYGTDHDPDTWPDPESFDPQRFADRPPTAWDLVPQGGGDPHHGHRCAGEDPAVRLIMQAATILSALDYQVPEQDLSIRLDRMPTRPRSGFVITGVKESQPIRRRGG
jgi:fatty-acid peroxygenase